MTHDDSIKCQTSVWICSERSLLGYHRYWSLFDIPHAWLLPWWASQTHTETGNTCAAALSLYIPYQCCMLIMKTTNQRTNSPSSGIFLSLLGYFKPHPEVSLIRMFSRWLCSIRLFLARRISISIQYLCKGCV